MEDTNSQMSAIVWLVLAGIIGLVLYVTSLYQKKSRKDKADAAAREARARAISAPRNDVPAAPRVVRNARQRMVAQRNRHAAEDSADSSDSEPIASTTKEDGSKVGTKKLKKLQQKAEKKAEREEMEREREERKKQEKLREEERKREEEREKLENERLEEEARLRKEEKERQEREEYLKLKEMFTVEEEGELAMETEEESQSKLREFVDFIKKAKVVMLEDLASQFSLRVQEAIDRVTNLQEMGILTGVMDDRGKFIYISDEELQNVAKFIKRRGRVAISELAECSNKLIGMEGLQVIEGPSDDVPQSVDVAA